MESDRPGEPNIVLKDVADNGGEVSALRGFLNSGTPKAN